MVTWKKTILLTGLICLLTSPLMAYSGKYRADFPLEIINIKPAGTGDPAIGEENRIFWAYPGIEYNIRTAVIGGEYPYSFSLSNEPEGMNINENTGEITWPNPQANASDIEVIVTDSQENTKKSTWSITVTNSTKRFVFVDSSYDGTETGSINNPYSSVLSLRSNEYGNPNKIAYFRNGTYNLSVQGGTVSEWDKNGMSWDSRPAIWIAYPQEKALIDCNEAFLEVYDSSVKDNVYFDGFEIYNCLAGFIYSPGNYFTLRKCTLHDNKAISETNKNYGFVYLSPHSYQRMYPVFQDNEFYDFRGTSAIGSIYKTSKMLIEDNYIHHAYEGKISLPALATKHKIINSTIRHNRFDKFYDDLPITGASTNGFWGDSTNNTISFNLCKTENNFEIMGSNDNSTNFYIYRNTFMGNIRHNNLCEDSWAQPLGPYYYEYNVIQNSAGGITYAWNCCENTIDLINCLTGTSGIVDDTGSLTDEYAEYEGTHGWETTIDKDQNDTNELPVIELRKKH